MLHRHLGIHLLCLCTKGEFLASSSVRPRENLVMMVPVMANPTKNGQLRFHSLLKNTGQGSNFAISLIRRCSLNLFPLALSAPGSFFLWISSATISRENVEFLSPDQAIFVSDKAPQAQIIQFDALRSKIFHYNRRPSPKPCSQAES